MTTDDAKFNNDSPDRDIRRVIAERISNALSANYFWIKLVAVVEIIFASLRLLEIIIASAGIIEATGSIIMFASAYFLLLACKEIRRSYEYSDINAIKDSLKLIGRYFMTHTISIFFSFIPHFF